MFDQTMSFQLTCPFCGSLKVATDAKKKSLLSYRHCDDCGEVWHPDRLPTFGIVGGVRR